MAIISVEIMKTIDEREMQKTKRKNKQRQKGARGTEAIMKGWFCCANFSPKIRKLGSFGSNLVIFIFSRNFTNRQIRGRWFQIWLYCFQMSVQKYANQTFLVPNLRIFIFALAARQIRWRWFQIKPWYFQISTQNTQIRHLWSQI